jgi:hypothetical protein
MRWTPAVAVLIATTAISPSGDAAVASPATGACGADGPHLDIDICHLASGGEFTPMEARATPCPGGQTWAAWWHAGDSAVYANRASASPCALVLTVEAERLRGTFACRGLVSADGTGSVDILDGRFDCVVEPRDPPRPQASALLSRTLEP